MIVARDDFVKLMPRRSSSFGMKREDLRDRAQLRVPDRGPFGLREATTGTACGEEARPRLATRTIIYACNLPSPDGAGRLWSLDLSAVPSMALTGEAETEFVMASLPGGQVEILRDDGEWAMLRFRWLCVSAHPSIGAVWRCFVQQVCDSRTQWRAVDRDYIFDAHGGALLNTPEAQEIALPTSPDIGIVHPEGTLTSFPCASGRIKITQLSVQS